MKNNLEHILLYSSPVVLYSCSPADSNYPGSEYMPDMALCSSGYQRVQLLLLQYLG